MTSTKCCHCFISSITKARKVKRTIIVDQQW